MDLRLLAAEGDHGKGERRRTASLGMREIGMGAVGSEGERVDGRGGVVIIVIGSEGVVVLVVRY
jgi:hypothetical protein